jgi:hypothetical protein
MASLTPMASGSIRGRKDPMLREKHQGGPGMVPKFQHRYAKSCHVRFKAAEWGGLQTDVFVVVANIPLEAGFEGYDEAKVEDLRKAVSRYVKFRHSPYGSIEFVQEW